MDQKQSFWYLENIDVTNIFCPQKLGAADDSMAHKTFKKGDYIYLPGDMADKIFFVSEGPGENWGFSAMVAKKSQKLFWGKAKFLENSH